MTRARSIVCLALPLMAAAVVRGQDSPAPEPVEAVPAIPAPPPVDETPAPAPAPMSIEELEQLGLNTQHSGVDTSLHLSGFMDFTAAVSLIPKSSVWRAAGNAPPHSTFYVGNFNVYLSKNLTEELRTLAEVRLSYLPNGANDPISRTTVDTTVGDYNDFGRTMRWAGIQMQRLYLEWTVHPLITLRAGQFLTPYGIWNVDHGTPVYVPIQRPFVVGLNWFPERQTGFEVFGRWDVSIDVAVGYHLTLSNGTGPISEYQDLDENKALGARAYVKYLALGELNVGGSVYYGRDTSATNGYFIRPSGDITNVETVNTQFDSLAWAADVSWKYRGLQLQAEWISYQRAFTEEGRVAIREMSEPQQQLPADSYSWGMYGLAGYRFTWFGIMPYVVVEHIDGVLGTLKLSNITLQAGINARPIESLTLKLGFYYVKFVREFVQGQGPLNLLQAQAAWIF